MCPSIERVVGGGHGWCTAKLAVVSLVLLGFVVGVASVCGVSGLGVVVVVGGASRELLHVSFAPSLLLLRAPGVVAWSSSGHTIMWVSFIMLLLLKAPETTAKPASGHS